MRLLVLCFFFYAVTKAAKDNPLKALRGFHDEGLRIYYSNTWLPAEEGDPVKLHSMIAFYREIDQSRFHDIQLHIVNSLPNDTAIFVTKNGSQVSVAEGPEEREIILKVPPTVTIEEVLGFILDQVFEEPSQSRLFTRIIVSVNDWKPVVDLLISRKVKTTELFVEPKWLGEENYLKLLKSTEAKNFTMRMRHDDGSAFSDAFFNDFFVQNLQECLIRSPTISQLTDETLLKLKAVNLDLGKAPKITLAAVRRFVQPALDGTMNSRRINLKTSFHFDEAVFLEGLNVTRLPSRFRSEEKLWTGVDGTPKGITVDIFGDNFLSVHVWN